jgi:hypothetical protein
VGPYSLSYDTSTSGVVVSLDGVVQRNSVDFNIVGTALTFTSTVGTGIIINVVFTGLTLSFPTPSDGSVDSSAIVAGAVDDSHISGLAATKLTGTIADARFPATLPAASGVNLTALNATNIGSGTVPTARLGSGTASSSTFLRGDQTYAAAGGGWAFVSAATASSSSSLSFTNMVADYDYQYVMEAIVVSNDQSNVNITFGVAGPTYRTSGYFGVGANINNAGTSQSGEATAYIPTTNGSVQELGNNTNEGLKYGYVLINNPVGTTNDTCALGSLVYHSQTPQLCWINFGGFYATAKEAHTSIQFSISAGTMTSGSISQFRRARS